MTAPANPWGCHNTQRKPSYAVINRIYRDDGTFIHRQDMQEDRTSTACNHRTQLAGRNDPRCAGCTK